MRAPRGHRLRTIVACGLVSSAGLLAACSTAPDPGPSPSDRGSVSADATSPTSPGRPTSRNPGSSPASSPAPTSTTSPATTPAQPATKPNPVSIPALIAKRYDGRGLTLGRESGSTSAYRQFFATYRSGTLTISGRINIPRGAGPFPAVVLAHGYVDPAVYTNGETMLRERDYLARRGYITLHIDYRNHAQSSDDPNADAMLRLGYTEDAINAGLALQKDPRVDPNRIALIGRSMGGGVVYNAIVVAPKLFKAAVAYAPVSSNAAQNFDRWVRTARSDTAAQVVRRIGTPERAPKNWANASPRTFFDRVETPLMIHHGTADEDCPIVWSEQTVAALKRAGKAVTYHVYPGQRHTMTTQWPLSIRRSEAFIASQFR